MKEYEIYLQDVTRILIGEMPIIFILEVAIRTAVVYFVLIGGMRVMGKRMASQLSRNEMAAMVSLAAAIGVPIHDPTRGLLPAILIGLVIFFFQYFISLLASKNERFESSSQDDLTILIADGKLIVHNMRMVRISKDRIWAELRSNGVKQLGEVERLYLEANGSFSFLPRKKADYGLCIIPERDPDLKDSMSYNDDIDVCLECGELQLAKYCPQDCQNCGKNNLEPACLRTV